MTDPKGPKIEKFKISLQDYKTEPRFPLCTSPAQLQLYTLVGNCCEINSKSTFFYATEMAFSKKRIPRQVFHVIL